MFGDSFVAALVSTSEEENLVAAFSTLSFLFLPKISTGYASFMSHSSVLYSTDAPDQDSHQNHDKPVNLNILPRECSTLLPKSVFWMKLRLKFFVALVRGVFVGVGMSFVDFFMLK